MSAVMSTATRAAGRSTRCRRVTPGELFPGAEVYRVQRGQLAGPFEVANPNRATATLEGRIRSVSIADLWVEDAGEEPRPTSEVQ
jgi:hypothetical protein